MNDDDLVDFLRARLDEDEQAARAAGESRIAWLTYRDGEGQMCYTTVAAEAGDGAWTAEGTELPAPASALVVYDPARVLREVEAKQQIMDEHANESGYCRTCTIEDRQENTLEEIRNDGPYMVTVRVPVAYPCRTLRLLSSFYAEHPDYRQEWIR